MKSNKNNWGLAKIWNESLVADKGQRPVMPRDHLWASELGKAKVDIWLKLKGVEPTNPPNMRSLRKFEAGNIWEWIVSLVLKRAGILQESQEYLSYQYEGLLKTTGKLDFLAGGKPDYKQAEELISEIDLPIFIIEAGRNIVKYFSKQYPDGIEPMILEIKSISSFMFDAYERSGRCSKNHRLQLVHYLKSKGMKKGLIVYICKDDCRMLEVPVLCPSFDEENYYNEIKEITEYFNKDIQPPLEQPIIYDEDIERFAKNWQIAYSSYLTKLYKFKNQMEFDDKYSPVVERWNRVLSRVKDKKNMTDNNLAVLGEMIENGYLELLESILPEEVLVKLGVGAKTNKLKTIKK